MSGFGVGVPKIVRVTPRASQRLSGYTRIFARNRAGDNSPGQQPDKLFGIGFRVIGLVGAGVGIPPGIYTRTIVRYRTVTRSRLSPALRLSPGNITRTIVQTGRESSR